MGKDQANEKGKVFGPLPGAQRAENHLSLGQRWAYLCGGIQWYGDLLGLLFYFCLLVGAANIAFSAGLIFRKLTGFLSEVGVINRATRPLWRGLGLMA